MPCAIAAVTDMHVKGFDACGCCLRHFSSTLAGKSILCTSSCSTRPAALHKDSQLSLCCVICWTSMQLMLRVYTKYSQLQVSEPQPLMPAVLCVLLTHPQGNASCTPTPYRWATKGVPSKLPNLGNSSFCKCVLLVCLFFYLLVYSPSQSLLEHHTLSLGSLKLARLLDSPLAASILHCAAELSCWAESVSTQAGGRCYHLAYLLCAML